MFTTTHTVTRAVTDTGDIVAAETFYSEGAAQTVREIWEAMEEVRTGAQRIDVVTSRR